uniref:Glucuronosyltransferase n=1 Tax=Meloidogyne hapla TaxID=6305 RepID=A0A1I8AX52_MELHA
MIEHPQCVVLVSFGTVKLSGDLNAENIKNMFERFEENETCRFDVRIERNLLPENYDKDKIKVKEGWINQQKILCT